MTAGINWDGTFKSSITHAASWGSAVRQEISKVKNSAKDTQKELAAMISESVDLETDAGKKNKSDINQYKKRLLNKLLKFMIK